MTKSVLPSGRPALCLAPMAGFSDRTFRLLCRERGADMVTSEMISAKGLLFMSKKTRALYLPQEGDAPYAVQLFGSEPETVAKAVRLSSAIWVGFCSPSTSTWAVPRRRSPETATAAR